jgi:branched-chain amino acid transport system ATP-binding protein
MIDIQNITVDFGGVRALNQVTAQLDQDIVGIIGPNGAGKTTLLNVLSGFVRPGAGAAIVDGVDVLKMPAHRRARWGLRRTFQTEQVVDDLSVWDNVGVMLDVLSYSRAERQKHAQAAIDFVGLTGSEQYLGRSLNAFERRMVEIARTVAGKPKIIMMDEPGAGLSESEGDALRTLIQNIPAEFGATVLLIDHDVSLIAAVCKSTAVLDFGTLIAYGPTREVLQDPHVKAAYLGVSE